jgi:hypothetical protein
MIGTHATQQEIANIKPGPQKHIAFQVWAVRLCLLIAHAYLKEGGLALII